MIADLSHAQPLAWTCTPAQAIRAWPEGWPLAALVSGGDGPRSRWSILTRPTVTLHDGLDPGAIEPSCSARPLERGWIVALAYDLGHVLEPAVGAARRHPQWPLVVRASYQGALVHDHVLGRWFRVGAHPTPTLADGARFGAVHNLVSVASRESYQSAVERALEYIRAGDIYQVNLSHVLEGSMEGSARALAARLLEHARPRYGCYLEWETHGQRRAVVSASPELFLEGDLRSRRFISRPMKGTRPASAPAHELAQSPKDAAELAMIIDLVRNDLGRVARVGTVRVEEARLVEGHGGPVGVHQGVGTVACQLRDGAGLVDLLRATFPGGSITGAPKIRAMRIIRDLEEPLHAGMPRGLYCGALGLVDDCGAVTLAMTIRTALIADDHLRFPVGAGIVAESDPAAEWRETLAKASILTTLPTSE